VYPDLSNNLLDVRNFFVLYSRREKREKKRTEESHRKRIPLPPQKNTFPLKNSSKASLAHTKNPITPSLLLWVIYFKRRGWNGASLSLSLCLSLSLPGDSQLKPF